MKEKIIYIFSLIPQWVYTVVIIYLSLYYAYKVGYTCGYHDASLFYEHLSYLVQTKQYVIFGK